MRTLSIQFQPSRSPDLTVEAVTTLMARIAASLSDVREFTVQRGSERDPCINYFFTSRAPARIWMALGVQAFAHRRLGPRLRRATIVTCQGSRGWDNYLLLHHFDQRHSLDRMAGA
jgi:hypothetical protein